MDLIYIVNTILVKIFLVIFHFFSSRCCPKVKVNMNLIEDFEDRMFNYCFEMQKSEVAGFRRLRTISQLIFETVPQLVLQIRIFLYFNLKDENDPTGDEGVDVVTLAYSIIFALIHALLEWLIIYIESRQYDLQIFKYFIICFNGRLGWVPMLEKMKSPTDMQKMVDNKQVLDFDDIKTTFCNMEISTEFIFSDMTADTLAQNIYKMKTINDENNRPSLRFGKCMAFVNFESVMKILDYSSFKIKVEYENVDLKTMMMASKEFLDEMERDNETGQAGKFLQNVVNLDHVLVMKTIFELVEDKEIKLKLKHEEIKNHDSKHARNDVELKQEK